MTSQQYEALAALRTRSDWQTGGQPQLMTLPYTQYGWLFAEVRLDHQQAQNASVCPDMHGQPLAVYQAARIIEAMEF